MYMGLKHLHMLTAALSIAGFAWRGGLRLGDSALLQRRWLKIAAHVIDTLLLATAIALAVLSAQYPLAQSWLTARVLGLVVYIALGLWVMRFARSQGQRALGYVLALATFGYIVAVAITRSPWPF